MTDQQLRRRRGLLIVLLAVTLCFIWGNSLLGREESSALSRGLLRWLIDHGFPIRSEHLLRKLAHFGEFGLLGCELMLLFSLGRSPSFRSAGAAALAGLAAAAADETLQLFSGRSAQLTDVMLDFSGALTGICFISLVCLLIRRYKTK